MKHFVIRYKSALVAILAVVLLYGIFYIVGIGCPIKYVTGISCGGCGMTRAYLALLHLDFVGAFHYHPLFFLPPLVVVLIMQKRNLSPKVYWLWMFTIIATFFIMYLLRLLDSEDTVVVFRPKEGLIFRIYSYIISICR